MIAPGTRSRSMRSSGLRFERGPEMAAHAGRGAIDGSHWPGARSSENNHLQELQRNALPSGGYSPLHAVGAYQLRRRREAILEREAALRLFVGDRLAEGWTPEQISGWLKSGNEPRLRAIGCETIYAFIYPEGRGLVALSDTAPQAPSPSRQTLARRHQGSSFDPSSSEDH